MVFADNNWELLELGLHTSSYTRRAYQNRTSWEVNTLLANLGYLPAIDLSPLFDNRQFKKLYGRPVEEEDIHGAQYHDIATTQWGDLDPSHLHTLCPDLPMNMGMGALLALLGTSNNELASKLAEVSGVEQLAHLFNDLRTITSFISVQTMGVEQPPLEDIIDVLIQNFDPEHRKTIKEQLSGSLSGTVAFCMMSAIMEFRKCHRYLSEKTQRAIGVILNEVAMVGTHLFGTPLLIGTYRPYWRSNTPPRSFMNIAKACQVLSMETNDDSLISEMDISLQFAALDSVLKC